MKFRAARNRRSWRSGDYLIVRDAISLCFWNVYTCYHRRVKIGKCDDLKGDRGAMALCRKHAEGTT